MTDNSVEKPIRKERKPSIFSLKIIIRLLIGIGLLLFLMNRIGFLNILTTLTRMQLIYIPLVFLALFLSHLMNGQTLKIMSMDYPINRTQSLLLSLKSWSWGQFTPARVGEFSLIFYLSELGMPIGAAASLAFMNRIIVLVLIMSLALPGLLLYGLPDIVQQCSWSGLLIITAFLLAVFFFLLLYRRTHLLSVLKRHEAKLEDFKATTKRLLMKPAELSGVAFTQILRLMFLFGMTQLLFLSLGTHVDYVHICIINSIARLGALIPISINGLGVREGLQVWFYAEIAGIDAPATMSVALLMNAVLYLSAFAIIFLWPIKNKVLGIP